jgi:hypothetical protein
VLVEEDEAAEPLALDVPEEALAPCLVLCRGDAGGWLQGVLLGGCWTRRRTPTLEDGLWSGPPRRSRGDSKNGAITRKERTMDDAQIHKMIEDLVAEEHRLWEDQARGGDAAADRQRLAEVKVSLDRCWDLLRQRRAYEEQALDADAARARDESVVENYLQ